MFRCRTTGDLYILGDMDAGHRALRRGRHSMPGQVYLVTFVTAGRRTHFGDWTAASEACRALTSPALWQRSRLLAWVLMPDHWHGLIELGRFESLDTCVGRLKGRSARHLRQADRGLGLVWARGYHDRALREEEDLLDTARYIVLNPLRAGLVRRVGAYPFWDACWVGGAAHEGSGRG